MSRLFKLIAIAIVVSASMSLFLNPTPARGGDDVDWVKLGEAAAGRNPDQDEFDVQRPDLTFSKIRFRVHGPAVHFVHVQVTFGDDDKEEIDLDANVVNDHNTAPLGLHGKHRSIKHVVVSYQTVGHHRGGDGIVSLWGLS